jgi:acyl phosphate:glycerol-3-phosphate acyltransferase
VTMPALLDVALVAGAYLVGSIPIGILVGRGFFGVDPRSVGSGNIGAANALRALGKVGAVLVLLGDVVKGVAPTAIALFLFHRSPAAVAAVGLATIVGHNWSCFLKFSGGKGVATSLGVIVILSFPAALVWAVVWLATALISRYSSLASLLATVSVPIALLVFGKPLAYVVYAVVTLVLVAWQHRANIRRLLDGSELRIGAKT